MSLFTHPAVLAGWYTLFPAFEPDGWVVYPEQPDEAQLIPHLDPRALFVLSRLCSGPIGCCCSP